MSEPMFIIVRDGDIFLRHLGGIPTPRLLDLCNDGRGHEAWAVRAADGTVESWRAREDAYDALNKPADESYVLVQAGRNPRYQDYPFSQD
jgi:hypothetical protein